MALNVNKIRKLPAEQRLVLLRKARDVLSQQVQTREVMEALLTVEDLLVEADEEFELVRERLSTTEKRVSRIPGEAEESLSTVVKKTEEKQEERSTMDDARKTVEGPKEQAEQAIPQVRYETGTGARNEQNPYQSARMDAGYTSGVSYQTNAVSQGGIDMGPSPADAARLAYQRPPDRGLDAEHRRELERQGKEKELYRRGSD